MRKDENIDLQAPLEGEKDKAYWAYLAYRDLGEQRTEGKAYEIYLNRIGGGRPNLVRKGPPQVSSSFKRWSNENNWEARARDWDSKKLLRIQNEQVEQDRQSYLDLLEKTRAQLDRTARIGLDVAEIQLSIGRMECSRIAKQSSSAPLQRDEVVNLAEIMRINKGSIETLAAARQELFYALGVEDLQGSLQRLGELG